MAKKIPHISQGEGSAPKPLTAVQIRRELERMCAQTDGGDSTVTELPGNILVRLEQNPETVQLLSDACIKLGEDLLRTGKASRVLALCGAVLPYARNAVPVTCLAGLLLLRGRAHFALSEFDLALQHYRKALGRYRKAGDSRGEAHCLNNIGTVFKHFGDLEQALEHFLLSRQIWEQLGDVHGQASIHSNIGNVYFSLQQFDAALAYHREALRLKKADGSTSRESFARTYGNIGVIHFIEQRYAEALRYMERALRAHYKTGLQREIANTLGNIGRVYQRMERIGEALESEHAALAIAEQIGDKRLQAILRLNIGRIHLEQGSNHEALVYLEHAHALAQAVSARDWEREICQCCSDAYAAEGDFHNALRHHKRYTLLQQELLGIESRQAIAALQLRYDTHKAEKERVELHRQLLQSEHRTLRAQINPHFIFNALNSIQHFLVISDREAAKHYLSKFARLMHLIMENSRYSTVPLRNSVDCIALYLELEQLRFGARLEYSITLDPHIDIGETRIPPMLIQPFVENAIWHGLLPRTEGGALHVSIIRHDDDTMHCIIDDNGIGRAESARRKRNATRKHRSAGMQLIRERLDILSQTTGRSYEVEVIDKWGPDGASAGTRVVLRLPLGRGPELDA